MKMFNRIAIATALMVPAAAAPASAQSWKWDLGFTAGYAMFTNSINSDSLGSTGDNAAQVRFKSKPRFGGTLGYWFNDKIGVRANYKFMQGTIAEEQNDLDLVTGVNMHSGTGDLLFRLGSVNETWSGSEFLPYLALGLGAKWVNTRGDAQVCQDPTENKEWNCTVFNVPGSTRGLVAIAEDKTMMGLVGLGADWRLSPHMAISLEASDRIFRPAFARAVATGTGSTASMPNGDHRISKWTHELGADIGLKFLFGLKAPEIVAVAPAPPPPPAPVVPPPPPPPPAPVVERVDNIQVCVVDPSQPNGLRVQNAMFLPASGDTMVMVNGSRVRIGSTVGNVMVARNADWYVRGEPLTLTIGKNKMQYSTDGGARMIEADKLSYVGTVNGFPVYADKDEVADVYNQLADLRRANASRDLGSILDERKDLRDALDDVKLLYVPLQATGCVFQTVRMMEMVKKGK